MNNTPSIAYQEVAEFIIRSIPEFKDVYEEHLRFFNGEVVNHILMAKFVRFTKQVCDNTLQEISQPATVLKNILNCIEVLANSSDPDVDELVQVSFMENLHIVGDCYDLIRQHLGSKSLQLLKNAESFWLKDWLEKRKNSSNI
jgi:hypothetical protein